MCAIKILTTAHLLCVESRTSAESAWQATVDKSQLAVLHMTSAPGMQGHIKSTQSSDQMVDVRHASALQNNLRKQSLFSLQEFLIVLCRVQLACAQTKAATCMQGVGLQVHMAS
jgi:hypothetical protein